MFTSTYHDLFIKTQFGYSSNRIFIELSFAAVAYHRASDGNLHMAALSQFFHGGYLNHLNLPTCTQL